MGRCHVVLLTVTFLLLPTVKSHPDGSSYLLSPPHGLVLIFMLLYAALGSAADSLWKIDPAIGLFLFRGLPAVSIPAMQRVNWVSNVCHFVSGIRNASGKTNFWICAERVSQQSRNLALSKTLAVIQPVVPHPTKTFEPSSRWRITHGGLVYPSTLSFAQPMPDAKSIDQTPSARDFLLFAAIDYHVFREWEVQIYLQGRLVFSTKDMPPSSVVDVDSVDMALLVVTAQMVRRPHAQSVLRARAQHHSEDDLGPYILHLDTIDVDEPICAIDFHSYAPEKAKVCASLQQMAEAYYRVVQYVKKDDKALVATDDRIAEISVGQTLWIAILGGVTLDHGRLTIQNLPGRWAIKNLSSSEVFLSRVDAILELIRPYANKPSFFDLVFSGGTSRSLTLPFIFFSAIGQMTICYALAALSPASVWLSVALANMLLAGRLTDIHSRYHGRAANTEQPGMKMYLPGTHELMAIATFDASPPKENGLRQGFLLNSLGFLASIAGVLFQEKTRAAFDLHTNFAVPDWLRLTCILLSLNLTMFITITTIIQQKREKEWFKDSETPLRWTISSTVLCSLAISVLTLFRRGFVHWFILDSLIWMSGLPLGVLENGRMIAVDDTMIHLVLLNRWIMGIIASAERCSI